jgi:hypothetical protein
MPKTPKPPVSYRQAHLQYGSIRSAARAYRIPFATFHGRLRAEIAAAQQEAQADISRGTPSAGPAPAAATRAEANRIAGLEKALAESNNKFHALLALSRATIPAADWHASSALSTSTQLIPVLFTSDMHCGEVVDEDEMDGINSYNMDIFRNRYQLMIEKTIEISRKHMGPATYPGVLYLRGGDAISGNIHEEIRESNELSAVPALRECFMQEREGIRRLVAEFGKAHVISVPGNHGRTTVKPRHNGYGPHNFETLLAWWLRSAFEGDSRVSFHQPASGDAYFSVMGWNVLLNHGDRMGSKGGMGFVGPAATIARGHWKLYDNWTRTGHPVSYVLTGHLHTSLKLERGYANGSLAGFNPFARDMRALPDAPRQWLLYFHRDLGICDARELVLGPNPRRTTPQLPVWTQEKDRYVP